MNLETFVANGQAAQAAVDEKLRAINPTPLLCREHVRQFLLDMAKHERPFHKFTRVSEETLITANEHLRVYLIGVVKRLPSKGKTI